MLIPTNRMETVIRFTQALEHAPEIKIKFFPDTWNLDAVITVNGESLDAVFEYAASEYKEQEVDLLVCWVNDIDMKQDFIRILELKTQEVKGLVLQEKRLELKTKHQELQDRYQELTNVLSHTNKYIEKLHQHLSYKKGE